MGQRQRKQENQKSETGLACNLDFAKKRTQTKSLKQFPIFSKLRDLVSKPT